MVKRIPIARAKEIAEQYGYEKVFIVGITQDETNWRFWLTTYGKNKEFCERAKQIGDGFLKTIGVR